MTMQQPIAITSDVAIHADAASALFRTVEKALSGSSTQSAALERAEAALAALTAQGGNELRELRVHVRAMLADHRKAQRLANSGRAA